MFKKKILIVDDTELMVKLIGNILIAAGYDVVSAVNGLEGLQKVREEKPDKKTARSVAILETRRGHLGQRSRSMEY